MKPGWLYNYFRYYDPEIACYLSQDPLGLRPGPNPSAYIRHPGIWSYPLGLYGCELADLGGGWYRSSEGLDYGPGSAEGHRITHVMQHTRDNPAKPAHGVFDTGNGEYWKRSTKRGVGALWQCR
ncbi:RHS repeat-associated core domain-containing protein [Streptomyces sp. NPDC006193]|uniref:RHS repeat-associated core domain-containing protein n=1 Tax=Streptomyces sp. NPDC006193 TaxID=3155717 RepID=UPI0033B6F99C